MKPRIKTFVNEPRRKNKDKSEKMWTNNNAESINHVFKVAIKWKPQSTPELIKKLYDCVLVQFVHLRGCLHDHGDYALIFTEAHYKISDQIWRCKTEQEKLTIFENFLLDKKRKRKITMISSSDGKYFVVNKAKTLPRNLSKENGR